MKDIEHNLEQNDFDYMMMMIVGVLKCMSFSNCSAISALPPVFFVLSMIGLDLDILLKQMFVFTVCFYYFPLFFFLFFS